MGTGIYRRVKTGNLIEDRQFNGFKLGRIAMARLARGEMIDPSEIQICHTNSRCVRRAFLCGDDPFSGGSYEHRRQWIRDRLEFLASVFGIDCLTCAIVSEIIRGRKAVG